MALPPFRGASALSRAVCRQPGAGQINKSWKLRPTQCDPHAQTLASPTLLKRLLRPYSAAGGRQGGGRWTEDKTAQSAPDRQKLEAGSPGVRSGDRADACRVPASGADRAHAGPLTLMEISMELRNLETLDTLLCGPASSPIHTNVNQQQIGDRLYR